jgi:DinB superfamily
MDGRAQQLAARFEEANRDVIAAIEGVSETHLGTFCPGEQCTVAALGCHVADVHRVISEWMRGMLASEAWPPVTMDEIDRANAEAARRNAACGKEDVLDRLRAHGAEAAALVRSLRDEDLDRSAPFPLFGGGPVTVQTVIENVLIGDPVGHLRSIQAAVTAPIQTRRPDRPGQGEAVPDDSQGDLPAP